MMRLSLAAIGRLKAGAERDLLSRYTDRIAQAGKQTGLGPLTLLEIPESARASVDERRAEEARALLDKLPGSGHLIALDETGKAMTSEAFAGLLGRLRDDGISEAAFAIGGPDGHGKELRDQAQLVLSLGPMTLPHGLARVVLSEQLYRAITILAGHPYHRS